MKGAYTCVYYMCMYKYEYVHTSYNYMQIFTVMLM